MTIIYNFYGAPSSGKSVAASKLFYELKMQHKNVELVTEHAKEWAWEQRKITKYDQLYIVSQQINRETRLFNKVDYIVTDSPAPLGCFYEEYYNPGLRLTRGMMIAYLNEREKDGIISENIWLENEGWGSSLGRYHDEAASRDINGKMYAWLRELGLSVKERAYA